MDFSATHRHILSGLHMHQLQDRTVRDRHSWSRRQRIVVAVSIQQLFNLIAHWASAAFCTMFANVGLRAAFSALNTTQVVFAEHADLRWAHGKKNGIGSQRDALLSGHILDSANTTKRGSAHCRCTTGASAREVKGSQEGGGQKEAGTTPRGDPQFS